MWLMGPDGLNDSCNFRRREATAGECCGGLIHGIDHIVPAGECLRIFRAVPDKHAQVVEPRSSVDHIIIVGHPLAYQLRQRIQARLVTKLVDGQCLAGHVLGNRRTKVVILLCIGFCFERSCVHRRLPLICLSNLMGGRVA